MKEAPERGPPTIYFTDAEWFSLPLAERRRWWEITDYGRKRPDRRILNRYIALIEAAKAKVE